MTAGTFPGNDFANFVAIDLIAVCCTRAAHVLSPARQQAPSRVTPRARCTGSGVDFTSCVRGGPSVQIERRTGSGLSSAPRPDD